MIKRKVHPAPVPPDHGTRSESKKIIRRLNEKYNKALKKLSQT